MTNPVEENQKPAAPTTIVGGQPSGKKPDILPLMSLGVEKLLAMAAVNDGFAAALLEKREAAIIVSGVMLTDAEKGMLLAASDQGLQQMIRQQQDRIHGQKRRNFLKLAASLVGTGIVFGAIAIPGMLRARASACEGNSIGSLRTLATAQAQFQSQSQVDQNANGTGEYGLFNELCGASSRRDDKGGCELSPASPTFISSAFRVTNPGGYITRSGYHFQVFLPHQGQVITDHPVAPKGSSNPASILAQETQWIAYAWPVSFKRTGTRCFVVNQYSEILAADNAKPDGSPYYSGSHGPPYYAALDKRHFQDSLTWGNLAAVDNQDISYAMDGQVWRMVGC